MTEIRRVERRGFFGRFDRNAKSLRLERKSFRTSLCRSRGDERNKREGLIEGIMLNNIDLTCHGINSSNTSSVVID